MVVGTDVVLVVLFVLGGCAVDVVPVVVAVVSTAAAAFSTAAVVVAAAVAVAAVVDVVVGAPALLLPPGFAGLCRHTVLTRLGHLSTTLLCMHGHVVCPCNQALMISSI